MLKRFPVEGGEIALLSTVQGLVAEAKSVEAAFAECAPRAVALGTSPESVAALLRFEAVEGEDPFDDLPDHEYVYAAKLGEYGAIALPPPDLVEAARLAKEADVPLRGVDLTEEQYEEAFTKEVSTIALLWYGRVQRKLARKPPKAADARAFSLAWDARIRKVRGLARVEARRERTIAERASALAGQVGGVVLLIVDAPREAGVAAALAGAARAR